MTTPNYNTLKEDTPLIHSGLVVPSSASSVADIPNASSTFVHTVFGNEYANQTMTEKAAALITTNRRKRPVFSILLGVIFSILVVTLSLSLIRGYSDYSAFRATHDIPRRVNVTAMINGDYYYDYSSSYSYSTTTSTYTSTTFTSEPTF
ncbi:hypothetical protein V1512DRAFT_290059 [Lipomyces arxii]|uniref:uncharacterized protein n=1 Tax=Lipomyces arxii TaxID=56418 RepID=UPI0034CD237A